MKPKVMPENNQTAEPSAWQGPPVAFFWDQSLVWGLICRQTLRQLRIPFHLLSGADIGAGALASYRVLLAPGGWAAHKIRALGKAGRDHIARFIERGGSYLGFCGGAGMALSSPPSLELTPFERVPPTERLPNASGGVIVRGIVGHPAWQGLPEDIPTSIWWPAQFSWQFLPRSLCLGFYKAPGEDFWVADLPLADFRGRQMNWADWEKVYGINLDPQRLLGLPAMLETRRGRGRLILSYPHMETPGDSLANRLLGNVLGYLDNHSAKHLGAVQTAPAPAAIPRFPPGRATIRLLEEINDRVRELIAFGERQLLWFRYRPWLLRWQRGIRGLEYSMLAVSSDFLLKLAKQLAAAAKPGKADPWLEPVRRLQADVDEFCSQAKILLTEEKLAAQTGQLTKLGSVNERVDLLRKGLFGARMNHGGLCRQMFDAFDGMLLQLLRQAETRPAGSKDGAEGEVVIDGVSR